MKASNSRSSVCVLLCLLFPVVVLSQNDSLTIDEISVSAFPGKRPVLRIPGTVEVLDSARLDITRAQSLLPAMNSVSGVRMEERSPGSYRLSVRGSLLRSPFGVRNLKVYMDEMPLTNAGGETYINLIDQWAIQNVEIHKGPDGSLFGANSGGVVRLGFFNEHGPPKTKVEATAGSYDLYRGSVRTDQNAGKHRFFVTGAVDRNGGYRNNSSLSRYFLQAGENWKYNSRSSLKIMMMYASLHYETPGALTASQQTINPRSARPASGSVPGAEEQQAGIYNNTLLGSATHEVNLTKKLEHLICVFGSLTDFRNPFITNYETRDEKNFGFRTWLRYHSGDRIKHEFALGAEQQFMNSKIANYTNRQGSKGTLLGGDETDIGQGFIFARAGFDFFNRFLAEGSLSLNWNNLNNVNAQTGASSVTQLDPQVMPRVAVSYLAFGGFTLRGLVSRGYSAPSLQELRPAAAVFNASLQPEKGWNYEVGARWMSPEQKYSVDLAGFIYKLDDAIVRRVDPSGNEYYVNAGGTSQPGVEAQAGAMLFKNESGWFRSSEAMLAATVYDFTFVEYVSGTQDYSGKNLTGVPDQVYSASLTLRFMGGLFLYAQHLHVSTLPLNDGNTVWAPKYDLLQLRAGWVVSRARPFVQVALACDNVLDQHYSSGHDLNAFGGRFYNPSPGRNYFAQLMVRF